MTLYATPKYSHLTESDFEKLYEPAEDTFLMLDALEKDHQFIRDNKPLICLEVGPGSGLIITFLATVLGPNLLYFASDINNDASLSTQQCGIENKVDVNVTTDSLLNSMRSRLKDKVDVLLFNPPYVVTPSDEVGSTSLSASWAGGIDGREVIDKFLKVAVSTLSEKGILYLLLLKENKPDEIVELLVSSGFESSLIIQRRTGPEHLSVYRFTRKTV